MKKIIVALAIAASLVPFTAAQAASISYSDTKALATTNWTDALSFNKFDSSLGTLTSIRFDLSGLVQGSGRAESLDALASNVTLSLGSILGLTRPDGSSLVMVNPVFSQVFNFTAFDGSIDFDGTSGGTTGTVTAEGANSFVSSIASDFALFSALGGGMIDLGLYANGASNGIGSGNLVTQFATAASGLVGITYVYTPNAVGEVPEPATIATLLAGLGLIGAVRRRSIKKS